MHELFKGNIHEFTLFIYVLLSTKEVLMQMNFKITLKIYYIIIYNIYEIKLKLK